MSEKASSPSGKMGGMEKPVSGAGRPGWGSAWCPAALPGGGRVEEAPGALGAEELMGGVMKLLRKSETPFGRDRPYIKQGGALQVSSRPILFLHWRKQTLNELLRTTHLIRNRELQDSQTIVFTSPEASALQNLT